MKSLVRLAALMLLAVLPVATAYADTNNQKIPAHIQPQTPVDLSQPLTLDRAIEIALQNQSTLGIAQAQAEGARARLAQNRAAYFPTITPNYTYNQQVTTQNFNGQTETGTFTSSVTQIGANLLIFDMGKREENILSSKYSVRSAQSNVLDTRQTIISNVATAYYNLMRAKDLVNVAQATVDQSRTTLDQVKEEVAAGTAAQKDILQSEADYDNSQVQLIIARNNVSLAQTTLKNAMGIITPQSVDTPNTPLPTPVQTPDTRTTADYLKIAFDNRQDLKRDTASIDANRHLVRVADINAGFQIGANISEGYRVDPNPGENRNFTTTFSYPLFDGGATRAAVHEAKANLEAARKQVDLTKQTIQLDVEQAYLTREEARSRIAATQAAVTAATANLEAARAAQKEGAISGTLLDVITAQAALVTAQTNAVQAIYDFYTADAQLSRAIGSNDPGSGSKTSGGKKR